MIEEVSHELHECETQYIQNLASFVQLGLFDKAQALIADSDDKVQEMIRGASESVGFMI